MPWAAAIPIVTSLIGQQQAQSQQNDARNARSDALAQFNGVQTPEIDAMKVALDQYQSTGVMTPEMQQAIQLGQSAMQGVQTDPRLQASQMQALQQVAGMAAGNPSAADTAGFELARQNAAGEMQAKNNQVLQEMQQRGQAGSGAELLAKLKNNQSGAQMLQQADLQQAQAMQQARMAALSQQAGMATSIRGQDFSQASDLANAKDKIAQFNAQNSQNVSNANVGARNIAQAGNLDRSQNLANSNVNMANEQELHNKGLLQQNYNNQVGLAGSKAGQYNNQASAADQAAGRTANMWSTVGQGVGGMVSAYGSAGKTANTGNSTGDNTFNPKDFKQS